MCGELGEASKACLFGFLVSSETRTLLPSEYRGRHLSQKSFMTCLRAEGWGVEHIRVTFLFVLFSQTHSA